jgi:hypothetical protein
MKTTAFPPKHSINCAARPPGAVVILLVLACCALLPQAQAVIPPPDGGYPNQNTAEGEDALFNLSFGQGASGNTAMGYHALHDNTTGFAHTAIGSQALANLSGGTGCTAIGWHALYNDTFGGNNTAVGADALQNNSTGVFNVAIGFNALLLNSTGTDNIAAGVATLSLNTTGSGNDAYGTAALNENSTGSENVAIGGHALAQNPTGNNNIALGSGAGYNLLRGSFNIYIGNSGGRNDSSTIRIGGSQRTTYIAGISGATVPTGVPVIVDADGHLGTTTSSARFKDSIKPMDKASEAILALKPVTFHYKHELDPKGISQFGLVAEDVEKVNPDLVARDEQGKPFTVRYEAVNAMLLNEFLKARRQIDAQQKQIESLVSGLQKVRAQLELSRSSPQTALNSE